MNESKIDPNEFIGLTLEEAEKKLGKKARVTREDNESFMVTMDMRADRLNVRLDNGKVTSAYYG